MKNIVLALINGYRYVVSPFMGRACRFDPTCSAYAEEAIRRYSVLHGGWLALCRLLKCHPFHPGGFDPVVDEPCGLRQDGH